jgi:hypothetical protein
MKKTAPQSTGQSNNEWRNKYLGKLDEKNIIIFCSVLVVASFTLDLIAAAYRVTLYDLSFALFSELLCVFLLAYLGIITKNSSIRLVTFSGVFIVLTIIWLEITGRWFVVNW